MSTSHSSALHTWPHSVSASQETLHHVENHAQKIVTISSLAAMKPQGDTSPSLIPRHETPTSAAPDETHRPRSPKKSALAFSLPLLKASRSLAATRESPRAAEGATDGGRSASTPTTPRSDSPRASSAMSPSRRERTNSSPQAFTSPGSRVLHTAPDVLPSPRHADSALIRLGDEVATLILAELAASKTKLNKQVIDSLARTEIHVPVSRLSEALRSRLDPGPALKLSHAQLIRALFQPLLLGSEVGKTLVAMRKMVMMQYDGWKLTLAEREQIEQRDMGFKSRMQANIEHQARACAEVALGLTGAGRAASLSASKLPPELIAFWRSMDRQLCEWAARNPELDASLLRLARENLGFDILFTRLILPIALGSREESHLVIPMIFYDAVKQALKADWPALVDSFIAMSASSDPSLSWVENALLKKSTTSPSTTTTTTTTMTTTTTTTTTTTAPERPDATS